MATDISDLLGKVENEGKTPGGRVGANEFNRLVQAVIENQSSVKSVTYGQSRFTPDENGNVDLLISESNYILGVVTSVVGIAPYRIAVGNPFPLTLGISNKYINGDAQESVSTSCIAKLVVNDIEAMTFDVYDGDELEIDVGPYLAEGVNRFYVEVNNGYGNVKQTLTYEVTAINIGVELPYFSPSEIQTDDWQLAVRLTGSVTGNVHIVIDNVEVAQGTQTAGSINNYTITAGKSFSTHKLKVYAEYLDDTSIRTVPFESEYIYAPAGVDGLVIGTTFADSQSVTMYHVLNVPYWIFSPGYSGTKVVTISVLGDSSNELTSTTQEVVFTSGHSGMRNYALSLFDPALIGDRTIRIACDGTRRDIPITINRGEVDLTEVGGADLVLSSAGRSDTDQNYNVWQYGSYSVDLSQIDFTDIGSGWHADRDGNIALHIRRGHEITIPYYPFATNPAMGNGSDVPGTKRGMTISIELATRNCIKRDASVVRCIFGGIGFEFKANSMMFSSNSESLAADYKEDTHVRIDLVIEGTETQYQWKDGNGQTQTSLEAAMLVYVDGVYQQMRLISGLSNFMQSPAQPITIGSEWCDVDLYCVRAYQSALNYQAIVRNYAYDTPVVEDKIAIAQRNDVFDSLLSVSYQKLLVARPHLPIMVLHVEDMPTSKTAIPLPTTSFMNPDNPDDFEAGKASFTSTDDTFKCQGTSSMNYPVPYRNLDFTHNNIIVAGQHRDGYRTYPGEPLSNSETAKKDYASSEMANNVIFSMLYNQMAVNLAPGGFNTLSLAQKAQYNVNNSVDDIIYRQSLYGFPMFIFKYWDNAYTPIGMFNFITNKDNEKVLGFTGAFTWENAQAQCWEIRDNNVFWDTPCNEMSWNDTTGKESNDIYSYYEARYPKKTKVGNDKRDFGHAENSSQVDAVRNETAALLRLHNWLVSVNQRLATGAALSSVYVDSLGHRFSYDTAAYRLAKFINEQSNYLVIDSWIMYYIWRQTFHMMDSGSKNLNLYTMDGVHWGAFARDCDTGGGIDNEGRLGFPFYLEDNDYIVNGAFVYNQTSMPNGAGTILNGQLGSIWINIRDGYNDRTQQMFKYLYDNRVRTGFGYEQVIAMFEQHQSQWSEALYNYGMRQYRGGTPYSRWIESGLGDKKNQRRYWMYYAFRYRMSKYHAGTDMNSITWRTRGYGCDLLIKPYTQMYVCLGLGNYNYNDTIRYRCLDPEDGVLVSNLEVQHGNIIWRDDNVTTLFNGDLIVDMGDLYKYGNIGSLDLTYAIRLRSLRLGSYADRNSSTYINTNQTSLTLTNAVALEYIDLTNCQGLGTGDGQNGICTLDFSNQLSLETLYLYGASNTGIILPKTATLKTVVLGANLRSLRLVDCPSIENFSIQGTRDLTSVTINNTSAVVNRQVLSLIQSVYPQLTDVNINDVDWTLNNAVMLEALSSLGSRCKLKGRITVNRAITFTQKKKFLSAWGNIDDESNELHIIYDKYYLSNFSIEGDKYIDKTGETQVLMMPSDANANNFVNVEWHISNEDYATIDDNGVLHVHTIGPAPEDDDDDYAPQAVITCSVRVVEDGVERSIERTKTVYFYQREAHIGDYVFHDGTYSNEENLLKTTIGKCFFNEVINGQRLRLMVGLKDISKGDKTTRDTWGCCNNDGSNTSNYLANIGFDDGNGGITKDYTARADYTGFASDKQATVYDTPLTNFTSFAVSGITLTGGSGTNGNYVDADGNFKTFSAGTGLNGNFANIGLHQLAHCMIVNHPKDSSLVFDAGESLPVGQWETLVIINHRNYLLENLSGRSEEVMRQPVASENKTEFQDLEELLTSIYSSYNNVAAYRTLFYPAASRCFAYEPSVKEGNVLSDDFKAHKWWLPSCGELARLCWLDRKGFLTGGSYINMRTPSNNINYVDNYITYFSSSEGVATTEAVCYRIYTGDSDVIVYANQSGYYRYAGKTRYAKIRPVCKF